MKAIRIEFQNLTQAELDVILTLRANRIKAFYCPDYPQSPVVPLEETGSGFYIPDQTYDIGWVIKEAQP